MWLSPPENLRLKPKEPGIPHCPSWLFQPQAQEWVCQVLPCPTLPTGLLFLPAMADGGATRAVQSSQSAKPKFWIWKGLLWPRGILQSSQVQPALCWDSCYTVQGFESCPGAAVMAMHQKSFKAQMSSQAWAKLPRHAVWLEVSRAPGVQPLATLIPKGWSPQGQVGMERGVEIALETVPRGRAVLLVATRWQHPTIYGLACFRCSWWK